MEKIKLGRNEVRANTDGISIKFKIESQVQELVLKSFMDIIQSN